MSLLRKRLNCHMLPHVRSGVAGRDRWRERGRAAIVAELVINDEYLHWRVGWAHYGGLRGWLG
jgi:hypothetical protein